MIKAMVVISIPAAVNSEKTRLGVGPSAGKWIPKIPGKLIMGNQSPATRGSQFMRGSGFRISACTPKINRLVKRIVAPMIKTPQNASELYVSEKN